MITVYIENEKKLVKKDYDSFDGIDLPIGSWIHLSNPTIDSINKISELTGIANTMLMASLDEEESARIDIDDGDTLVVLDTPYLEDEESARYSTAPFIIAYNRNYYVTISKHNFELIDELFKRVKVIEPHKHVRLTLYFVFRLATLFITYLKKIDIHTKEVENTLRNSMKNRELFELMDMNKTLVYFSTALSGDKGVLSKLLRTQTYKKFEDDFDLMEDAQVELDQATETCTIYRDILAGMMDAFASIISNNLNIVMKTLAVVTIVLSIPTLVASIWGMNVENMPLAKSEFGFYILIGISILCSIIGAIILIFVGNHKRRD